ncbi:MAG: hypothetical protein OEW39_12725, partial [Deltaproteobacteria bacterium]|nr:hypothetical protein [Deltaproteobacteria bacterium]
MSEPSPESSTPKVAEPDYGAYRIRRRKRWQPLRRWLEFALARTVLGVTRWLPIAALQALGRALGTLAYRLAAKQRGICRYQMALALPTLAELEREALIQSCFRHFGMTACEALGQRRLRQEGERWVRLEGEHVLRSAHAQGKGVMLVTAHTGNWELLPIAMDRLRLPTTVVVRPLHNPRLNAVMRDLRQSPNLELAERGTQSSPRQLLGALRQGRVLVMA